MIRTFYKPLIGAAALFLFTSLCPAQTYTISGYAGNNTAGFSGDAGAATSAQLNFPFGVAVDTAGNLYIADQLNNRIRKVTTSGTISTVAGNGTAGYTGDGAAATSAELTSPTGIAIDKAGNLYIADSGNNVIRKVTSAGTISTIAGSFTLGAGYAGDGAAATSAQLNSPSQLAVDSAGNLYIADTYNNIIRKLTTDGNINTIIGNNAAVSGSIGDGGAGVNARLNNPTGVAVDSLGNVYVADTNNNRVRKLTTDGIINTVAGTSVGGFAGDGGIATSAKLTEPKGIALDSANNIYIADADNSRIRVVSALSGYIASIAGNGSIGYGGDGGLGLAGSLYFPSCVTVDGSGNVYFADNQNNVVRKLSPMAQLPVIYTSGVVSATAFGGYAAAAPSSFIEIYGTALAPAIQSWSNSFTGINAPTALLGTSVSIGGQPAYVAYVSPGQVNVQVPSTVTPGAQQLILTTAMGTTSAYSLTIAATEPGILAPATFVSNNFKYAAAFHADGTFVLPTAGISGVTGNPAKPGETITIYGLGFGPVTPAIPAGQLVQSNNTVASPVVFSFGGVTAISSYSGLAPNLVGVYQFNVVVPSIPNSDAYQLTVTVGGTATSQTLYIAVHN